MEYEHGTHDEWECPGESACNGQRANTVGRHTSGCAVNPCTCGRQHVGRQPVWRAAHAFMERLGRALGRPWRS